MDNTWNIPIEKTSMCGGVFDVDVVTVYRTIIVHYLFLHFYYCPNICASN